MPTDSKLKVWRDVLLGCLPFFIVIALNCYADFHPKRAAMHHGIKAIPPHGAR